ncbi:MAG: hypothetical protein SF053_10005 [Bacteroidia bacterium]|nr:hypothetical protein [Bacteroidia bacterium]
MKRLIVPGLGLLFFLAMTSGATAQASREDSLRVLGEGISIKYREAASPAELQALVSSLGADRYPLVIMRKPTYSNLLDLTARMSEMSAIQDRLVTEQQQLEALRIAQEKSFQEIAGLEKERAELFRQTSDDLLTQSKALNAELTKSMDLMKESLRGMKRRSWYIGALGAVIGVTTGTILGLVLGQ